MCRRHPKCNAFTIRKYPHNKTNRVFLHSQLGDLFPGKGDEQGSGVYMMGYDMYQGVSPDESFYLGIDGESYGDCLHKCDDTRACGGFTEFKDGSCRLYGKDFDDTPIDPGFTPDPDSVFYRRPHMVFEDHYWKKGTKNPCIFGIRIMSHIDIEESLLLGRPVLIRDKTAVLQAVMENGNALEFAGEFVSDKEVVIAAVTQDGTALRHADTFLKMDRDIVLLAIANNACAFRFADPFFCRDREVVIAAVSGDGNNLFFADPLFWADREVVISAVSNNGDALEYARDDLKADKGLFSRHLKIVVRPSSLPTVGLEKQRGCFECSLEGRQQSLLCRFSPERGSGDRHRGCITKRTCPSFRRSSYQERQRGCTRGCEKQWERDKNRS